MPLEIVVDGETIGKLPDEPWALPDGGWNELSLQDGSSLVSVAWNVPPGTATLFNGTLGPDARIEHVSLSPEETVDLTFGEVDAELIALFGLNLPVVSHVVTLRRTNA